MPSRTITALYDDRAEADAVVEELALAGFPRTQISLVDNPAPTTGAAAHNTEGGFLAALRDMFLPEVEYHTYAEGIRRGGTLLSVRLDEGDADRAVDILERSGAVDLDSLASEWRSAGWSGDEAGVAGASALRQDRVVDDADEAVIPVIEEQLRVGKREVARGSVRVRSYVVEVPVEEQVSLREEHVTIERRAVDQPLGAANDPALFREKTIEVSETGEEAVVAKTARVREELVIRKDVEQRTERVADTVRHTEVEVEDTRTGTAGNPGGATRRAV